MNDPRNSPATGWPDGRVVAARQALDEYDAQDLVELTAEAMAYFLGMLSQALRSLLDLVEEGRHV